jgi:hypothetical protein
MQESTSRTVGVRIGEVAFSLQGLPPALGDVVRGRYAEFEQDGAMGFPVRHQGAQPRQPSSFSYSVNQSSLHLQQDCAGIGGARTEYDVDSLLRVLLSMLLVDHVGLLLHAATVLHQSRAYVFMGRSGAGKSTVAALSPKGSVLTDEISLIRFAEGVWRAYGTPFWGEFRAAGRNISAPLAGIFSLVQARENRRTLLPGKAALSALLANTLFFSNARKDRDKLLAIQSELLSTVPVYRLEFRKEESLWEVVA